MTENHRCKNCLYYIQLDKNCGFCRRYPPIITNNKHYSIYKLGNYPTTNLNWTCGEFKNG